VKKLLKNPSAGASPAFAAIMPSEKATAKYPIAMGIPSRSPLMIFLELFRNLN
jgi:hypothetical protein